MKKKKTLLLFSAIILTMIIPSGCRNTETISDHTSNNSSTVSDSETISVSSTSGSSEFILIPRLEELPDSINNNPEMYTSLLSDILKLYYTGIVSGRINSDSFTPQYSKDELPLPSASAEQRRNMAEYCTVGGALEYYGCDRDRMEYYRMYNGCLPYFCSDREGNIYLGLQNSIPGVISMNGFSEELYYIFLYSDYEKIQREADIFVASEVDAMAKRYYVSVKNGTIVSDEFQHYTHDVLPDGKVNQAQRLSLAGMATIGGALEYAGFYTPYGAVIKRLGYDEKTSHIYALSDNSKAGIKAFRSLDDPLSKVYG